MARHSLSGPEGYGNRRDAGRVLARHLSGYASQEDVAVLALPRGGVPVAFEVARALAAPLDVFVVRKLGVPGHEELAMGAVASGGTRVLNDDVLRWCSVAPALVERVTTRERVEIERRERDYRGELPPLDVAGRTVLLVDDGLATGSTMQAAVQAVRTLGPARIIVAAPVGSREACDALRRVADEVVCPLVPEPFSAVGLWYGDFSQTTDREVRSLLDASREPGAGV